LKKEKARSGEFLALRGGLLWTLTEPKLSRERMILWQGTIAGFSLLKIRSIMYFLLLEAV